MRYAVLHHVGVAVPHFDFVFEMTNDAPALTTFRCPRWPPALGDELEELAEHRRVYLDYEGDISGGRGSVRRVEAGDIDVAELAVDPPTLSLKLSAGELEMTLTHRFDDGARSIWVVATLA